MGSLTSRPKVPQTIQPQVVYVPATPPSTPVNVTSSSGGGFISSPVPTTPTTDNSIDTGNETPNVANNSDTEVRITNLLRRNRGLSGTIQTGFRGLLGSNDLVPQRKTLLGE